MPWRNQSKLPDKKTNNSKLRSLRDFHPRNLRICRNGLHFSGHENAPESAGGVLKKRSVRTFQRIIAGAASLAEEWLV